jgi:hypothetical protein
MERRRLGHTLRHLTTGGSKDAEGYENGPSVPLWDGPAPESSDGVEFQPSMDIRLHPTATGPLGAVLIMPGGGYGGRATDHEGYQIAVSPPRSCVQRWHPEAECSVCVLQERCNAAGFHAFILQYRVSPNVHPAPLMDASRAIRIVRSRSKEWGVHPDQIAVLGFSAGGHLAGSISTLHHRFPFEAQDDLSELSNRPDATIMGCAQLQPPRRLSLSLSLWSLSTHSAARTHRCRGLLWRARAPRLFPEPAGRRRHGRGARSLQPRQAGGRADPASLPLAHHGRHRRPCGEQHAVRERTPRCRHSVRNARLPGPAPWDRARQRQARTARSVHLQFFSQKFLESCADNACIVQDRRTWGPGTRWRWASWRRWGSRRRRARRRSTRNRRTSCEDVANRRIIFSKFVQVHLDLFLSLARAPPIYIGTGTQS